MSETCVFAFFFFFTSKNGFLAGIHAVLTVGWPFKPLVDCILHSYMYIHSVSALWYAVDGHMGPPLHCYTCAGQGWILGKLS